MWHLWGENKKALEMGHAFVLLQRRAKIVPGNLNWEKIVFQS